LSTIGADRSAAGKVTVVLPCLNERDGVGTCVTEALTALAAAGIEGEVVVVDNGSSDGSPQVASAAGARVVHEHRRGYGRALRTGFEVAAGEVIVMADADGTYDLTKIAAITRPVLDGEADLVLATRLDGATKETMPFLHRHVGTPVITFLTSRASGRTVTSDSQTGYRAFRRDRMLVLGLEGNGMELASEMLIKSARAGLRITNVEGGYRPRIGESKLDTWSDGWRHLLLILMLAPDLILIGPGIVLTAVGLLALGLGFVQPAGVEIGSARWQPVFFSGVALVLGLQILFTGLVVAGNSPVARIGQRRPYRFLRSTAWPRRAAGYGLLAMAVGLMIDVGLFVAWLGDRQTDPTAGVAFGLASLAQTLLILGGSLVVFGIVSRFVRPTEDPSPVDGSRTSQPVESSER
jgi:glycosyltransferase involved in cell wall biosynthesis